MADFTADVTSKPCSRCKEVKPLSEFHRSPSGKHGRRADCKDCVNAAQRAFQQAHKAETGQYRTRQYRYERTCEGCGAIFTTRTSTARFCSIACHNRSRTMGHVCVGCGRTWQSGRTSAKFCTPACRTVYELAQRSQVALHQDPTPRYLRRLPSTRPMRPLRKRWYAGQCIYCGAWFIHDQPQTVTCSQPCMKRVSKARRRALKKGAFVENVYRHKIFERDGWRCRLCGKPVKRNAVTPHPRAPVLDHIIPLARGGTHEPANVQCAHFLCNSIKGDRGGEEQLLLIG